MSRPRSLATESVQGASLPLECIDHIHCSDCLPFSMFGVGYGISDDILQENLENSTGFFIDKARDTLYTSTASQTSDGRLGDTLDVVSQHLTVTLGASLSKSLSSLSTSSHLAVQILNDTPVQKERSIKQPANQSHARKQFGDCYWLFLLSIRVIATAENNEGLHFLTKILVSLNMKLNQYLN